MRPALMHSGRYTRRPVRLRLALMYSGLFLAAGVLLVALVYLLAAWSPFPRPPAAPTPPFQQPRTSSFALLPASLTALAVTAVVAVLLGWFMAGRALRPVADMTATVRRITADALDRRLAHPGPDDELKELADTFDDLLDRLEAAFTAQRRFVAHASHELRTPLTLQQTLAEVALADPSADGPALRAVLTRLLAAGRQQETLIEALLTLARSQQGLPARHPVDLATLAASVLPRYDNTEHTLHPAPAAGDHALLERLTTNLLDNATRHNIPDGWIRVTTYVDAGRPTLRVTNSGRVIPQPEVTRLLEPFQRLDTTRRSASEGLGLGLSIVAAIVQAHHGTLTLHPLPTGGLEATVTLPPT